MGRKSGKTFEIREVEKPDPVVAKAVKNLKKNRDSYADGMVRIIMGLLAVFDPASQVELSEQLAVRVIAGKIRFDRAKYLARGKTIPEWPGSLEYQNRAATALLILLEPPYVLCNERKARPRKVRHNAKQRR